MAASPDKLQRQSRQQLLNSIQLPCVWIERLSLRLSGRGCLCMWVVAGAMRGLKRHLWTIVPMPTNRSSESLPSLVSGHQSSCALQQSSAQSKLGYPANIGCYLPLQHSQSWGQQSCSSCVEHGRTCHGATLLSPSTADGRAEALAALCEPAPMLLTACRRFSS